MPATVQILRTATANLAPTTLLPGQLAIEMASVPPKLWCGVDTAIDVTGMKLLLPAPGGLVPTDDVAPAAPLDGQLWWDSTSGNLFIRYDDATSSQWVPATSTAGGGGGASLVEPIGAGTWGRLETGAWQRSVAVSGDTMTGTLAIANAAGVVATAGNATLTLDRPAGSSAYISANTSGSARWQLNLASVAAEAGLNAGSDLTIQRFDDTGVAIDAPFEISRATGMATLTNSLSINGTNHTAVVIRRPAGFRAFLTGETTGSGPRWGIDLGNDVAESGGNAGSNFALTRYSDAGALIDNPLMIDRATAHASFCNGVFAGLATIGLPTEFGMEIGGVNRFFFFSKAAGRALTYDGTTGNMYVTTTSAGFWYWRVSDAWCYNAIGPVGGVGAYQDISDERGKTGITNATIGLAEVLQLNPISFTRIKTANLAVYPEIGFSAQALQAVIPEAVSVAGIPLADGTGGLDDPNPTLSIATTPIVAALVNAIKELNARLTAGGL